MAQWLMRFPLRWLIVSVVLGLIAAAIAVRISETTCPSDRTGAQRVSLANNEQVPLGDPPVPYRVHVAVLRDFGLKVLPRLGPQHPLDAFVNVQASTPAEMEGVSVVCVRVRRGADVWSRRPRTYDTTTSPGQPSAGAWRFAIAQDGPEWEVGTTVDVEVWLEIRDQRYELSLGSFTLEKGL